MAGPRPEKVRRGVPAGGTLARTAWQGGAAESTPWRLRAEASQIGAVCATGPVPGWRHENVRPTPLGGCQYIVWLVCKTVGAAAAPLLQDSQL